MAGSAAPPFEKDRQDGSREDLRKRPGASPRDGRVLRVATSIMRGPTIELPYQLRLVLDEGMTTPEISEIGCIPVQLGWRYMRAVRMDVCTARKIGADRPQAATIRSGS